MRHKELCSRTLMAALVAVFLTGMSWSAEAQTHGADLAQADAPREQLRHRFQEGIDASPGLAAAERQVMHKNLDACLKLGFTEPELVALFPDKGSEQPFSAGGLLLFDVHFAVLGGPASGHRRPGQTQAAQHHPSNDTRRQSCRPDIGGW